MRPSRSRRAEYRRVRKQYRGSWASPRPKEPQPPKERLRRALKWHRWFTVPKLSNSLWEWLTWPVVGYFLLDSPRIHPSHGMTMRKRIWLAWRLHRTVRRIHTGTSYMAHMAMAAKLLEIPPEEKGVVVECGSFQGGTSCNLSILCKLIGRELIVYDSFEGLPPPAPNDRAASIWGTGLYAGSLETVKANIEAYGEIDVCTFRKGWFSDTLKHHREPIVFAYLDVDYQDSIRDCVLGLWPHLADKGYVFLDEYVFNDYCAIFWSEHFWREHFDRTPPGLIGSGSGIGVGQFYLGPHGETAGNQAAHSVAFTRKDLSGYWDYYPETTGPEPSTVAGSS